MSTQPKHHVVLDGRDRIEMTGDGDQTRLQVIGCRELLALLHELKRQYGSNVSQWPLPTGDHHAAILVRELLLKAQGKWDFPYKDEEICHCRTVATHLVDQAVIAGAHTPEAVSRLTSASTACGTCRPDVQKVINFRLGRSS